MRRFLLSAALLALPVAAVPAAAKTQACAAKASDASDVERTIKGFFAAIEGGDFAGARDMMAADFHAFDAGRHLTGPELVAMVEEALKVRKIDWDVGKVETKVVCDIAWTHWLNTGSIDGKPTVWQESAVLRRAGDGWILEFLHSEKIINRSAS